MAESEQLTIEQAITLAESAVQQGNYTHALELYEAILQHDPHHPAAISGLQTLQNALSQGTSQQQNPVEQLISLYQSGQMERAEQACRELLKTDPNALVVINILGAALQAQGKLEAAIEQYDKAIQLKPDFAAAYSNRGNTLKELGAFEEALKSYNIAVELKPDNAESHYNRGNVLIELKRFEQAVESYDQAIQFKPELAEAYSNRGTALSKQGQLQEAVESYNSAIKLRPDYVAAYCNRGNTLQKLEHFPEAIEDYNQAISLNPDFIDAYFNLGNALQAQGHFEEAVSHYHKAIQLNPDYPAAYCNCGNALQKLDQWKEALESYQQAIQCDPQYTDAYYNYGNALQELRQLELAITQYDKVLEIDPEYADAYYTRGNALKELGAVEEAIKSYRQCLQRTPDNQSAQHILNAMQGNTSNNAPAGYVEELFNKYANNFEASLVNKLHYTMPTLLREAAAQQGLLDHTYNHAVDLGCGTGLVGAEFRQHTSTLVGIDLSQEMVHKAEEKQIYDQLIVDNLIDGLEATRMNFDLFLSADVFIYVGALSDLFKKVKQLANQNALFIFSTEDLEGEHFILQETGRFAHSFAYIQSLASTHGFKILHHQQAPLRKEKETWITGGIYLLKVV